MQQRLVNSHALVRRRDLSGRVVEAEVDPPVAADVAYGGAAGDRGAEELADEARGICGGKQYRVLELKQCMVTKLLMQGLLLEKDVRHGEKKKM